MTKRAILIYPKMYKETHACPCVRATIESQSQTHCLMKDGLVHLGKCWLGYAQVCGLYQTHPSQLVNQPLWCLTGDTFWDAVPQHFPRVPGKWSFPSCAVPGIKHSILAYCMVSILKIESKLCWKFVESLRYSLLTKLNSIILWLIGEKTYWS